EQNQKQKAARKHQQQINVREIKFRPKIAQHDYDTKKGHVERFLKGRDKVKVTIMFRGREMAHPERGEMILNRLAEELGDLAVVEQRPQQDGRNMTMKLAPQKATRGDTAAAAAGERRRRRRQLRGGRGARTMRGRWRKKIRPVGTSSASPQNSIPTSRQRTGANRNSSPVTPPPRM